MNKIHRIIWNEITATWVAVAEIAKGHSKRSGTVGRSAAPATLFLPPLKALVASLALIGAILPAPTFAQVASTQLPTGGNVVAGTASITQNNAVMTINQTTNRAAIDWNTFNVGSAAQVNFNQPSSSSVTLNRVLDSNPSQIFGRINAPGQVFLTNPNGVYFAPGSSVNVGGLVATTHRIAVDDFMAGKTTFDRNGSTGSVINEGELKAALGGYIALLAPQVRNEGVIIAQAGTVALASGEAITLNFAESGTLAGITATQSQIAALVENKNAVHAPGGLIILSALAMNSLQGGVINNSGSLEASSLTEKGGRIILEGDHISLAGSSQISATGATGGGEVLIGGDWQGGKNEERRVFDDPNAIRQATTVAMESGATIDVSATKVGAGGTAVLWSDVTKAASLTTVAGTILAKGGAEGGDGGRIETSGYNVDIDRASISASAPNGTGGLWLIDPTDATINQTVANNYASTLNGGTSVENVVTGDITWSDNVTLTKNAGGDATLTLKATGSIRLGNGSSITSSSNRLNTILWSDSDNSAGGGIRLLGTASISTNGGHLWMGGGSGTTTWNGLTVGDGYAAGAAGSEHIGIFFSSISNDNNPPFSGTLNAGGGNISLRGKGGTVGAIGCTNGGNCNFGMVVRGTLATSGSGTITLDGLGGAGAGHSNHGVYVNGTVQTDSGAINITGVGGQSGSFNNDGIRVIGSVLSASGPITLTGTTGRTAGGAAANQISYGINGFTSSIGKGTLASSSSAISLVTDTLNLAAGASIQSTGTLTIAPLTNGTTIGIAGGAGTLALTAANFSTNFANGFSGITIGSATAGAITVGGGTTFNDSTTLQSNSTIALNGTITANENLILTGNGAITQSAAVAVAGTTSITAGSGNNITLDNSGNNFTGAVSVVSGAAVSIKDANSITLGNMTATGNLAVEALGGDLTLGGTITKSAGDDATLTLKATGNIIQNTGANISSSSNKLHTIYWADSDNNEVGGIRIYQNTTITTNGGNVTMGGGTDPSTDYAVGTTQTSSNGIRLDGNVVITAAGGNINIRGKSSTGSAFVSSPGVSVTTTGTGALTIFGDASSSPNGFSQGFNTNNALFSTETGDIHITGLAGGNDSSDRFSYGLMAGKISTTSGNITLTASEGTGQEQAGLLFSTNSDYVRSTLGGKITLVIDDISKGSAFSSNQVSTTGAIEIRPYTTNRNIVIGAAGSGSDLAIDSTFFSAGIPDGASGITIGSANAGAITVGGATTFRDSTTLLTNSTIALNGAITANENLTLTSNGAITQSAALGVTGTTSITAGSGNNITLDNNGNNFTGAVSVVSGNNISLIDSNALSLGAITAAGTVDVATKTGNLTLTGAVSTSNATASAITLNAAKDTAALTATGGDIINSGGSVSTGTEGRTTLYSGSVSGSTGLTALVGSGSGNFRYNSDETASNYTAALGSGFYAIYREQPTVIITANNATKTYDGLAYSGGNGVNYGGFVNGDNSGGLGGALAYGGTSQGATNAGSYAITPSGLTSGLGYNLSFTAGALAIDKANATVTANSDTKTYNGMAQSVTGFTASGLVNGETIAVLDGVSTSGGTGTNAGSYTHTASGTDENYNLSFTAGALNIGAAPPPPVEPPVVIPPEIDTSALPPGGSADTGSSTFTGVGGTGGTGGVEGAGNPNPLLNVNPALVISLAGGGETSGDGGGAAGRVGADGISISLDTAPSGNFGSGFQGGVVTVSVPKAMATAGTGFSFELPAQVRESLGTGALQATLADGNPLPGWIAFNPATQRFEAGAVPDGGLPLQVLIRAGTTQVLVVISERGE